MSRTDPIIAPVRKTVTVPIDPEQAFRLFTEGITEWWPLATHSVGLERSSSVSFDPSIGGELLERLDDGSTSLWGTVISSNPPHAISLSWHAGRSADDATQLDLTFSPSDRGGTIVELTHSGWERWEDGAPQAAGYDEGWDVVLGRFRSNATDAGA